MTTSQTLIGWEPITPTDFAQPVQDEDATAGLHGVELSGGKGLLVWEISGGVHFAVTDSTADWLVDDSVPSADIGTVVSTGSGVEASSVVLIQGEPYVIVSARASARGTIKIYSADSATNPTSWSLHGTVQDVDSDGTLFSRPRAVGVPLRLDSGRWVLASPAWEDSTAGISMFVGAWTSDDDGANWTRRLTYNHSSTGLPFTSFVSWMTSEDPATGYLYMSSGSDAGGVDYALILWRSTDSGSSWSMVDTSGVYNDGPLLNPFADNGTTVYAANQHNTAIYAYDGSGSAVSDWTDTGEDWVAPGVSTNPGTTWRATVTARGIWFFVRDQVMYIPGPAGCINPTPPLHIPFKDYLITLVGGYEVKDSTAFFSPHSFTLAADHDFDNLKVIERWANRWMTAQASAKSCQLHIPFKDFLWQIGNLLSPSPALLDHLASMHADNYSTIERWARRITNGECACPGPRRCRLHIPHKRALFLLTIDPTTKLITPDSFQAAAAEDFDNYKEIERWGVMYARGECV